MLAIAPNAVAVYVCKSDRVAPTSGFSPPIELQPALLYYLALANCVVPLPPLAIMDFELQRCTRRCAATERELQPDEVFYSVLSAEGAAVTRHDYCEAAWEGPPDEALGWWKSRMPDPQSTRMHWAPNDVMLHYFEKLEDQPDQQDVRYILSLLMIRRRILRLEDTERGDVGSEVLVVYCPRKEAEFRVPVVEPEQQRIYEVQEELARLLFGSAA